MNIPEGYKLVPVEPTEEMLEVLHGSVKIQVDIWERTADIINDKEWWAAVVESAPTPPQPIYDEAKALSDFAEWWRSKPVLKENIYTISRAAWLACAQSLAKAVEVGHE